MFFIRKGGNTNKMEAICKQCGAIYEITGRMPGYMSCTCDCKEFDILGEAEANEAEA